MKPYNKDDHFKYIVFTDRNNFLWMGNGMIFSF